MFIWSRTSTFSNDTGSIANMIATLTSALITACAVLYAGWTFLRPECESGAICDMSTLRHSNMHHGALFCVASALVARPSPDAPEIPCHIRSCRTFACCRWRSHSRSLDVVRCRPDHNWTMTRIWLIRDCRGVHPGFAGKHPYLVPMWMFILPFVGVFLSVVGIAYVGIDVLIPAALDDEGRFLSEDGFVDGPAAVSGVVDDVLVASCILGWLVGLGYFAGLLIQFYVDKAGMRFMMVEDKASPRSLKSLCAWFHCLPSLPEGYTDGFGFAVSTESEDAGGYLEVDGTQIKQ